MRFVFVVASFFFLILSTIAQNPDLDTSNRKALKLYAKGEESLKARRFDEAIDYFRQAIAKDEDFSFAYLKLANVFAFLREMDSAFVFYQRYYDRAPKQQIKPNVAKMLSMQYFNNGEYRTAEEVFDLFLGKSGSQPLSVRDSILYQSIQFSLESTQQPLEVRLERLSDSINRYALQYFPVLTIDNREIYYTKRDGRTPQYDEDIVVATWKDGYWTKARSISREINGYTNEGACTVSADGRTLIFTACEGRKSYGNCDLYISTRINGQWTKPQNLGANVNSSYWDSQPALSADAKTLFFASNRPGGRGKRDIWMSRYEHDKWAKPENLGGAVNTPFDETTPFIHVNGESLFFASEGHPGLGGFDIYISEREGDGWTDAENVGYPINDHRDQSALFITFDGSEAYFTGDYQEGSYIYRFLIQADTLISNSASYLTGTVRDKSDFTPLKAQIKLYDLNSQEQLYNTSTEKRTGGYFMALKEGGEYGAYVEADGYLFEDFRFDLESASIFEPDTLDILMTKIEKGATVRLENIYFGFDSYELLPKSLSELTTVADFLKKNKVKVQIAGHTDNVGSESYNVELSLNRAKSVYDYLVTNGVSEELMEYTGYGSKYPIIDDSSEEADNENRRIEFEIIEF
ncbi:MAG: OmpA family protein [Bacteroidota bacterium]